MTSREMVSTSVPWIGALPSDWPVESLKRNTYIKARVGWKGLTSDEFEEESYAYLVTGSDFRGRLIDWRDCYQVSKARYEDDAFIQLREGDLLVTKDGTIGKTAVVKSLDKPACLNSGVFVLRPTRAYLSEFLYWVLNSDLFRRFIDLTSTGSTILHLYQNVFVDFAFGVPSIDEQRAIVDYLDLETGEIDAFIGDQERLIALLTERRSATISRAITTGIIDGAPMSQHGHLDGEVPSHWRIGQLRHFMQSLDFRRIPLSAEERAKRPGPVPYYGASGVIDHVDRWIFDEDLVLVSEDGANLLMRSTPIAFVARGRYWVNNHAHVMRPIHGSAEFWAARIEALPIAPAVTGAAQPKLTADALAALVVSAPDAQEQAEIVEYLDGETSEIDGAIADAREAIALSKERRAALISAAVTGQIDVSGRGEASA